MGERICSDPDCQRPARARGMCQTHYGIARRRGDLVLLERRPAQKAGPGDRACELKDCDSKYFSRGLCAYHYGKAWRAKEFPVAAPTLPFDRHSLTYVDLATKRGHCSICGPDTKVRVRAGRHPECDTKRRLGRTKIVGWNGSLPSKLRKYGLTENDYERMLAEQGGACAICRETPPYRLHVDHCHDTGRVRGLLCQPCNVGIGFLRDDAERLRRAADYVG